MKPQYKYLLLRQSAFQNQEVATWVSNVNHAGSSVSSTSAQAHDSFVTSLKTAGVWPLILRLNTYGANDLTGALVPLVATVGGNTDVNHNFTSGDFSLATGLTGDGSTKYLDTGGLASNFGSTNSSHCAVVGAVDFTQTGARDLGAFTSTGFSVTVGLSLRHSVIAYAYGSGSADTLNYAGTTNTGFYMSSRSSATNFDLYRNGGASLASMTAAVSTTAPTVNVYVFGVYYNGSCVNLSPQTQQAYSLGAGLSASQVTAYNAALSTLMAALGRTYPV